MSFQQYRPHYVEHLRLALPVIVAQVGHIIGGIADSIMVGHISSVQLAAAALANSLYIIPMLFVLGILLGITPLIGKAFGENNYRLIHTYIRHALIISILLSFVVSFMVLKTSFILRYLNPDPEILKYAIPFYEIFAISIIPYSIFLCFKQIAEGLQNTKASMFVIIAATLLNIGLNFLLIYGYWGFPRLELLGAGYATLISRILMPFMMLIYLLLHKKIRRYFKHQNFRKIQFSVFIKLFKIGLPIGFQTVIEITSFSLGAIMIGWMGSAQLAAHQIAINLSALTYLISSGVAASATMRVSKLLGERDYQNMMLAGKSALHLVWLFMSVMSLTLIVGNHIIPMIFIRENEVLEIAAKLFIILGIFQLLDGTQVVMLGNLRGMHDVKAPSIIALIAYWVIELPVGYFLGFTLKMNASGVWYSYLIGLIIAAILLTFRYKKTLKVQKKLLC